MTRFNPYDSVENTALKEAMREALKVFDQTLETINKEAEVELTPLQLLQIEYVRNTSQRAMLSKHIEDIALDCQRAESIANGDVQ